MITEKDIRQFIIPKLAEAVNAAGRYKRPECEGCKKVWQEIQNWFDEQEKERIKDWIKLTS